MDYDFEKAIEKLLNDQRKTKKGLFTAMGLTRQGLDNKLKNKTISVVELSTIAAFFDMKEVELVNVLANKPTVDTKFSGNGDYLEQYLKGLEEKFNQLLDQLNVKDHQLESKDVQIAGLQRTVDALVGKFEGIPFEEGRVLPLYPEKELEQAI
jgi:hypothetical protein